jgi:putative serine protease PepD
MNENENANFNSANEPTGANVAPETYSGEGVTGAGVGAEQTAPMSPSEAYNRAYATTAPMPAAAQGQAQAGGAGAGAGATAAGAQVTATHPEGASHPLEPSANSQYLATQGSAGSQPAATGAPYIPAGVINPAAAGAGAGKTASADAKKEKSAGGKNFVISFCGAALACVLAFGIGGATGLLGAGSTTTLGSSTSVAIDASDEDETLAEAVSEKCLPSVAYVAVYTKQQTQSSNSYGFLFGYGSQSDSGTESSTLTLSTSGSGVVLSEDGYIITNNHVIEDGDAYKVTVNGETYDAELVGADSSSDIAVLKVTDTSTKFTPITIGDSDDIKVGEWVMTIGSPFGLEQSVATGIVSATSRSKVMQDTSSSSGSSIYDYLYGNSSSSGSVTYYPNMIQTDAAINPGNSGGALVDSQGCLIGINTMISSYSGNYSGVGFAIPSNYAIGIAQDLIEGKTPSYAQIGVNVSTVSSDAAARYGFGVSSGAYISSITDGSGAAAAGLQVGDIITKFGGEDITSATDLTLAVREKEPGDVVTIEFVRDGNTQTVDVTLGSSESTSISE